MVCLHAQEEKTGALQAGETAFALDAVNVDEVVRGPWMTANWGGIEVLSLANKRLTQEFVDYVREDLALFAKLAPGITPSAARYPQVRGFLKSPVFGINKDRRPGRRGLELSFLNAGQDMTTWIVEEREVTRDRPDFFVDEAVRSFSTYYRNQLIGSHRELPEWYRQGLLNCGISLRRRLRPQLHYGYRLRHDTLSALGVNKANEFKVQQWPLKTFLAATQPAIVVNRLQDRGVPAVTVYRDQCVLFLHWGLRGGGETQRAAFHRLAAVASERPVDETVFRECFGFGFEEAQQRFLKFIQAEVDAGLAELKKKTLRPETAEQSERLEAARKYVAEGDLSDLFISSSGRSGFSDDDLEFFMADEAGRDDVRVSPAPLADVWRSIGETYLWSVSQDMVLTSTPQVNGNGPRVKYSPLLPDSGDWRASAKTNEQKRFLSSIRESMLRFYTTQTADARTQLDPVLGQIELALGRRAEAVHFFQNAVDGKSARPGHLYLFARLQLEELSIIKNDGAAGLAPDVEKIHAVRAMLHEALKTMPDMALGYGALAHAWLLTDEVPPKEELTLLAESVRRFPENVESTLAIAKLCKRAGQNERAVALAKLGVDWLPPKVPGNVKKQLLELAQEMRGDAE